MEMVGQVLKSKGKVVKIDPPEYPQAAAALEASGKERVTWVRVENLSLHLSEVSD